MVFGLKDEELALQNENDDLNDRASLTNLVDKRLTKTNHNSKTNEVVVVVGHSSAPHQTWSGSL